MLNAVFARKLVEAHGYRTICLEAPGPVVSVIDRWCAGGSLSHGVQFDAFPFWHWVGEAFGELAPWLIAWNRANPDAIVRLIGIDNAYVNWGELDVLLAHLGYPGIERETPFLERLPILEARLRGIRLRPTAALMEMPDAMALIDAALDCLEILIADGRSCLRARRDLLMAANVSAVIEARGDLGGVVVFAHNDHVAKEVYDGGVSMGAHLDASLNGRLAVIGTSFLRGSVRIIDGSVAECLSEYPSVVYFADVRESFDEGIWRLLGRPALLDRAAMCSKCHVCIGLGRLVAAWLPQWNVGGYYDGTSGATVVRRACDAFDCIAFLPEISPARERWP